MYSFMDHSCETEEEFEISKALLFSYLGSSEFKKVIGKSHRLYSSFMRSNFFIHQQYFSHYLYHDVHSYGQRTSSAHEGTNNALKHCADAVLPSHTLSKSVAVMAQQDERHAAQQCLKANKEYSGNKLWTKSITLQHLNMMAESNVILQKQLSTKLQCFQVAKHKFLVRCCNDD